MTDLEKKRAEVRGIIEDGLLLIIEKGLDFCGDNTNYEWCKNQWSGGDRAVDTLCEWIEDEDGDIAIDRLVTLIIH